MSVPSLHDGVFLNFTTPQAPLVAGNVTSPSCIVGTAAWGKVGVPYTVSTIAQMKDAIGEVNAGTGSSANSGNDLPTAATMFFLACNDMQNTTNTTLVLIRVSSGSDTAATMTIQDQQGTPGNVITFTGICTGTRGNTGTAVLTQASTWTTSTPVYNLTLTIAFGNTEFFPGIVAYHTVSGTSSYDAPTLATNIKNAVNSGQTSSRPKSSYWVASTPSTQSTSIPSLNTFTASGGTDGATVTSSQLLEPMRRAVAPASTPRWAPAADSLRSQASPTLPWPLRLHPMALAHIKCS